MIGDERLTRNPAKWLMAVVPCSYALATFHQNDATAKQDATVTFQSKVNVVLVPVLALDAKGRAA